MNNLLLKIDKLERLVNREQTALLPAKSRSPKIILLMVCYDTVRFSLIQLFLGNFWQLQYRWPNIQKFTILTFWGHKGQTQGPHTKICLLIRNQGPKISIIPNFESSTLKKNVKIFTFRGPGETNWGSQIFFFIFFQLIWNQGSTISMISNFEGPTLKNKNFKILTFRGPGGQNRGPKPKFNILTVFENFL